ncbi:MAG: uracil-DNA glycosylase [Candidatus Vogelbacteria bacterium]|nr:uracil-DNA glycosylase [Candidatus Vogelbacteria bacterium]
MLDDRDVKLRTVRDEVLNLVSSPLFAYRQTNKALPVIGEGSHTAEIMFVGEAPGKNEAKTGRPFCGASGKFLDQLLASVNISRAQVYITNIVKDRPPANRDPSPEEIAVYGPFLDQQIGVIQPQLIVTLGRFSMSYIMTKFGLAEADLPISQNHGQFFQAQAIYGPVRILPLYHPAAAIYNQHLKVTLFEDFKKVIEVKPKV